MPKDNSRIQNDVVIEKKAVACLVISLLPLVLFACIIAFPPIAKLLKDDTFLKSIGRLFAFLLLVSALVQPVGVILGILSLIEISQDDFYRGKWCAIAGIIISILIMIKAVYAVYGGLNHM